MTVPASPDDAANTGAQSDASSLCTNCGLCCTGVLYSHAPSEEAEVPRMTALGMTVGRFGDIPHFKLPCRHNHDGRCGIYAERFSRCRSFRCELLKRLDAGDVSLAEAQTRVTTARQMVDGLAASAPRALQAIARRDLRAAGPPAPQDARVWIESLALDTYLDTHFRKDSVIAWQDDDAPPVAPEQPAP